jgi:hypothetical protein
VRTTAPVARELRASFSELTPAAPRLNRITTLAVPCERALQDALQWSLSVFKFFNTHGVLMRVQDVVSAESAGGQAEPAVTALPSCAPGAPAK